MKKRQNKNKLNASKSMWCILFGQRDKMNWMPSLLCTSIVPSSFVLMFVFGRNDNANWSTETHFHFISHTNTRSPACLLACVRTQTLYRFVSFSSKWRHTHTLTPTRTSFFLFECIRKHFSYVKATHYISVIYSAQCEWVCVCVCWGAGIYAFYQNWTTHTLVCTRQNRWVGSCALSQYDMPFVPFVSFYRWKWLTVHFNNDGTCYHASLVSASFTFVLLLVLKLGSGFWYNGAANLYTSKTVPSLRMDKRQKAPQKHLFHSPSIYPSLHQIYHTSSLSILPSHHPFADKISLLPSLYNICLTRRDIYIYIDSIHTNTLY